MIDVPCSKTDAVLSKVSIDEGYYKLSDRAVVEELFYTIKGDSLQTRLKGDSANMISMASGSASGSATEYN